MIKYIDLIVKKIKNMWGKNNNLDKLMALKDAFRGKKFQWIKTEDESKMGKVLTVRDIDMDTMGRTYAILEDGNRVTIDTLNKNMLMLREDIPPLSKAEIMSINDPFGNKTKKEQVEPSLESPIVENEAKFEEPQRIEQKNDSNESDIDDKSSFHLFSQFNSSKRLIDLKLNIEIPDKKLLKLMYANASDKDDFINQLTNYLYDKITLESVKQSACKLIGLKTEIENEEKDKSDPVDTKKDIETHE